MPSPFPGMDPYVEMQEWDDFHSAFHAKMSEELAPLIEPRYVARIARRIYTEHMVPRAEERREAYLVIRECETKEVITVIETLSPANKRTSSDGRERYLEKRQEILQSHSNLVEIDLLRGGARLPMIGSPAGDYVAIVSRSRRRPKASSYAWTLRQPMPTIAIPLKGDDADVPLDLQKVFTTTYERARYQLSLDYAAELHPALSGADLEWMRSLLTKA